jgi:hypothetical protein
MGLDELISWRRGQAEQKKGAPIEPPGERAVLSFTALCLHLQFFLLAVVAFGKIRHTENDTEDEKYHIERHVIPSFQ